MVLDNEREPQSVEFGFADDIVVKAIRFDENAPSIGNQHAHAFDHISLVIGPFLVYIGDADGIRDDAETVRIGGPGEPMMVTVQAHKFHRFCSLAPGGLLLCISRGHDTGHQVIEKRAPRLTE